MSGGVGGMQARGVAPVASVREITRGASITLVSRVAGGACEFGFNVVVARWLGAEGAGQFYLALTVATAASVVARLGLDNALLRLGAAHAARDDWGRVRSVAQRGVRAGLLASVLAALAVYAGAGLLPVDAATRDALRLAALVVAPLSVACLYSELLKSVRQVFLSQLVGAVVAPALAAVALLAMGSDIDVERVVLAQAFAVLVAALLGCAGWTLAVPRRGTAATVAWHEIFRGTWSLLWIKFARLGNGWIVTAALAMWATPADVGVYNVALRVSLALGLLLVSINSVVAPGFSALADTGDLRRLDMVARRATRLAVCVAGPLLCVLLLVPGRVMGLFGPHFAVTGAPVLVALVLGQCINLLTGPVNNVLLMSGEEKALRHTMTLALGCGALLTLVLVPRHGALGGAIATAFAMALQCLLATTVAWDRLGVLMFLLPIGLRPRSRQ